MLRLKAPVISRPLLLSRTFTLARSAIYGQTSSKVLSNQREYVRVASCGRGSEIPAMRRRLKGIGKISQDRITCCAVDPTSAAAM